MTNPTEPGRFQFQFGGNAALGRVAGKANDLTALLNPNSVTVMLLERTATVDFTYIVSFAPVSIPRFILW
jgi:hypothetical protein